VTLLRPCLEYAQITNNPGKLLERQRGMAQADRGAQKMTAASIPFFSSNDLDPVPGDGLAREPVLYRALIPCMYTMYHFAMCPVKA
jgi:hypothetical protein